MKGRVMLFCTVSVLVLAGAFAIRGLAFSRRITVTPVIVSSENGLFKINENGKSVKLIDTRKDFSSLWPPGFYKDDFVYTDYGSPRFLQSDVWIRQRINQESLQKGLQPHLATQFWSITG